MKSVFLINQAKTPHYRVPVYNHLGAYLASQGYALTVVSDGIQDGCRVEVKFAHRDIPLSFSSLARLIWEDKPDAVIFWVGLRYLYLFPILLLVKALGKKAIYWGHGSDWAKKSYRILQTAANNLQYTLCDALVLYAEHQKKHLSRRWDRKTFIANNTLCFDEEQPPSLPPRVVLDRYHIKTRKNIICMGRMQRRKRLEDLYAAFQLLNRRDIGLILVGPDTDGILDELQGEAIYKLGPIYGEERLELLAAADLFCLPRAVGLGIVDAFHCGVPLVTEEGDETPEIMYLKNGVNGFIIPKGDVCQLAEKLALLLDDPALRARFSDAAKAEINTNGHIDRMCKGFADALHFVFEPPPNSAFRTLKRAGAAGQEAVRRTREIGWRGILRRVSAKLSEQWRNRSAPAKCADAFDSTYGTDTAKTVGIWALDIPRCKLEHAHRYETIDPEQIASDIEVIPISHQNFVFIDFGCGKGRALMQASRLPFKEIIGVELSATLSAVANRNLALFHDESQKCHKIRSVCMDVIDFPLPEENILLYLFNPFDGQVMEGVVAKMEDFVRRTSRSVYVLYHHPAYKGAWEKSKVFEPVMHRDCLAIYRSRT